MKALLVGGSENGLFFSDLEDVAEVTALNGTSYRVVYQWRRFFPALDLEAVFVSDGVRQASVQQALDPWAWEDEVKRNLWWEKLEREIERHLDRIRPLSPILKSDFEGAWGHTIRADWLVEEN